MKENKKRGFSPIVATVLLISLAIMIMMMVFFWAKGFFSEQIEKNGKNIENVCKEIDLDILYEKRIGPSGDIKMVIRNKGSVPISSIEVREEGKIKTTKKYNVSLGPGGVSGEIAYILSDQQNFKTIKVYPNLLGKVKGKNINKYSACLTQTKIIKREDLI